MPRGPQARGAVDGGPVVVAVAQLGPAGVHRHPHAQRRVVRPRLVRSGPAGAATAAAPPRGPASSKTENVESPSPRDLSTTPPLLADDRPAAKLRRGGPARPPSRPGHAPTAGSSPATSVSRKLTSPSGSSRRCSAVPERGVVAEDGGLEVAELLARLEADLVDHQVARRPGTRAALRACGPARWRASMRSPQQPLAQRMGRRTRPRDRRGPRRGGRAAGRRRCGPRATARAARRAAARPARRTARRGRRPGSGPARAPRRAARPWAAWSSSPAAIGQVRGAGEVLGERRCRSLPLGMRSR